MDPSIFLQGGSFVVEAGIAIFLIKFLTNHITHQLAKITDLLHDIVVELAKKK